MSDAVLSIGIDAAPAEAGAADVYAALTSISAAAGNALASVQSLNLSLAGLGAGSLGGFAEQINNVSTATRGAGVAAETAAAQQDRLRQMVSSSVAEMGAAGTAAEGLAQRTGSLKVAWDAAAMAGATTIRSTQELRDALSGGAAASVEHAAASEKVAASALKSGAALGTMGMSAGVAARETRAMIDEALAGRWGQFDATIVQVGMRFFGLSGGAIVATAGVAALGAALAYPIIHAVNLDDQLKEVNSTLKATGDQANVTAAQLVGMANAVAGNSSASRSDTLTAGKTFSSDNGIAQYLNPQSLQQLTQAAADYAQVTGTTVPQAAAALARALDGGFVGIDKLNRAFPSLSATEMDNVATMLQHGKAGDALALVIDKIAQHAHDAAQGGISEFSQSFHSLGQAIADASDNLSKMKLPQAIAGGLSSAATGLAAMLGNPEAQVAVNASLAARGISPQAGGGYSTVQYGSAFGPPAPTSSTASAAALQQQAIDTQNVTRANQALIDSYSMVGLAQEKAQINARADIALLGPLADQTKINAQRQQDLLTVDARYAAGMADVIRTQQQAAVSAATIAEAYAKGTVQGLIAEAQEKALASARTANATATASLSMVNTQLSLVYDQDLAKSEQYTNSLDLQTASKQRLAAASLQGAAAERDQAAQETAVAQTQKELDDLAAQKANGGIDEATYEQKVNDVLTQRAHIKGDVLAQQDADAIVSISKQNDALAAQLLLVQSEADMAKKKTPEQAAQLAYSNEMNTAKAEGLNLSDADLNNAVQKNAQLKSQIASQQAANQIYEQAVQQQQKEIKGTSDDLPENCIEAFAAEIERVFA